MRRPRRLSPAERRVWQAYPSGQWVDLRVDDPKVDNPANGLAWGAEREVRAEVIASLLLGAVERQPGQVPGIRLAGARIVGVLDLSDATVEAKLHLLNCHMSGAVDLTDSKTQGIRLRGCELARIRAARATIDGLFELDGSNVIAGIRLDNTHIKGQFRLSVATIKAPPARDAASEDAWVDVRQPYGEKDLQERGHTQQEWALWAGGLTVEGGAFMRGLRTEGGLRLIGAAFPDGLYLQRATIRATGTYAIHADFMNAGAVECSAGFTSVGTVRMRGARITGVLSFDGADVTGGGEESTLHLSHLQVDELILRPARIEGGVNLGYSRIGVLLDRADAYPDWVRINGLTYESLRGGWTLRQRRDWLCRDPDGYRPQPYEQLAAWYRRIGHEPEARRVMLSKQREHRATLRPAGRVWGRLLDFMVGYGYRSWLAGVWALVMLTTGSVVFHLVRPAQIDPDEVRHFQPVVYTLDLLAPVSVFEVRGAWEPLGWTQWVAWALVVSGWILATALIAGATRVLRPAPGA